MNKAYYYVDKKEKERVFKEVCAYNGIELSENEEGERPIKIIDSSGKEILIEKGKKVFKEAHAVRHPKKRNTDGKKPVIRTVSQETVEVLLVKKRDGIRKRGYATKATKMDSKTPNFVRSKKSVTKRKK